jgi:hypothetical protein
VPIPSLSVPNADITILELENNALYTGEVIDPIFKATTKYTLGNTTLYVADQPVTILACIEQFSFCNSEQCTDFD